MSTVKIIQLSESDLGKVQMFCGHSPTYRRGYLAKIEWLRDRLREGMRYTILQVDGHKAGMIEYLPGESAWRGVEAAGYLFIHCFWVIGSNRKHGYGRMLLDACLEDAAGTHGVVAMVSRTHWLPTPKIFLRNGFELADRLEPSFDLLVRRFDQDAPLPRFKRNPVSVPAGLTLYTSDQCPYTQNCASIVMQVGEQMKLPITIIKMEDSRSAQDSPCPYGTLAYFLDGEFLSYHPLGTQKLMELLNPKLVGRD